MGTMLINRTIDLKNDRLHFLDNIRSFVIILVVIHHIAIVYGAFMPFYYAEQPFNKNLLIFCIVNQSWFMGILFLLDRAFHVESTFGEDDKIGSGSDARS